MADVTLGDHDEAIVSRGVESGRYSTISEVISDGLRRLQDREQTREMNLHVLRAAMAEGDERGVPEPRDMADIKTEGERLSDVASDLAETSRTRRSTRSMVPHRRG